MKLYLIDDFDKKDIELIKQKFDGENSKFCELDDFDDIDFESRNDIDEIYVFAAVEFNFVSKDCFKFMRFVTKNKLKQRINFVLIEKRGDNAKIAIDWLASLKRDYFLNVDIVGELDHENLSEEFEFLQKARQSLNICATKSSSDNNVTIYTDGACSGNPGAGGWGAVLMHGNHKKEISGFDKETTNNKMELTAVIEALLTLKAPCHVELYSDSAYVVNAIKQGWLENWKKNGWVGADKKAVKNIDLWQKLDALMQIHDVNFNKVKGHADNEFNNRCDALATGEIAKNANNM